MKILQMLPWADWLALGFFICFWVGYALFAKYRSDGQHSILAMTNRYRHKWMMQTTARDPRMLDGIYVVLGERRAGEGGKPAWLVRAYVNPWVRLIFLGPLIMALGGAVSLSDRRVRLGVGRRAGEAVS